MESRCHCYNVSLGGLQAPGEWASPSDDEGPASITAPCGDGITASVTTDTRDLVYAQGHVGLGLSHLPETAGESGAGGSWQGKEVANQGSLIS